IHDSLALIPLVQAIPAIGTTRGPRRRRPAKLRADKGYDYEHLRTWLRRRGITPRIARRGIESSEKLGRHRWIIERSLAWLTGYHPGPLQSQRSGGLTCSDGKQEAESDHPSHRSGGPPAWRAVDGSEVRTC